MKELTKIVRKKCQDCRNNISILCNESANIVAARCSDCLKGFDEKSEEWAKGDQI